MSTSEYLSRLHAQGRQQLEQGAETQRKVKRGISQLSEQASKNHEEASDQRQGYFQLGSQLTASLSSETAKAVMSHSSVLASGGGGKSFCGVAFALIFCTTDRSLALSLSYSLLILSFAFSLQAHRRMHRRTCRHSTNGNWLKSTATRERNTMKSAPRPVP